MVYFTWESQRAESRDQYSTKLTSFSHFLPLACIKSYRFPPYCSDRGLIWPSRLCQIWEQIWIVYFTWESQRADGSTNNPPPRLWFRSSKYLEIYCTDFDKNRTSRSAWKFWIRLPIFIKICTVDFKKFIFANFDFFKKRPFFFSNFRNSHVRKALSKNQSASRFFRHGHILWRIFTRFQKSNF